jgi:LPS O-antigen subunit length determinant protein (WzzB/FepE family)
MEEKEAELMDYLLILWRKKWIIILGILFSVVLTGVISLLLRPVYEVDAMVQPGKFFVQNEAGNIEQLVVEDPQQIADKVRHKSYDALIAAELKIGEEDLPAIREESIRNTLLTRVWIRDADVDLSKKVLDSLIRFIQKDIDAKIDVEFNNLDSSIKARKLRRTELPNRWRSWGKNSKLSTRERRILPPR